jgi:peptidoglycan/LPS O-acetylase OafA/YrhL
MVFFAMLFRKLQLPYALKFILVYGAVCSSTIILAYLSYQYFEKPFLRIKRKFEVVRTKPSQAADIASPVAVKPVEVK